MICLKYWEGSKIANEKNEEYFIELRVTHFLTGEERWMQLSSKPSYDVFEGCIIRSGFIFVITDKKTWRKNCFTTQLLILLQKSITEDTFMKM